MRAQVDEAFRRVAEEAIGKAVEHYTELVSQNTFCVSTNDIFYFNSTDLREQVEVKRRAAAAGELKRVARRRGKLGAELLRLLTI